MSLSATPSSSPSSTAGCRAIAPSAWYRCWDDVTTTGPFYSVLLYYSFNIEFELLTAPLSPVSPALASACSQGWSMYWKGQSALWLTGDSLGQFGSKPSLSCLILTGLTSSSGNNWLCKSTRWNLDVMTLNSQMNLESVRPIGVCFYFQDNKMRKGLGNWFRSPSRPAPWFLY